MTKTTTLLSKTALFIALLAVASCGLFASAKQAFGVPPALRNPIDSLDLTKGFFILNEDWFGHNNSTINFCEVDPGAKDPAKKWEFHYKVFQQANPGKYLGRTSQYGIIYGDHIFIASKQDKDDKQGSRFCMASKLDLDLKYEMKTFPSKDGSQVDSRAILGVDTAKLYVSTNQGIYIFDAEKKKMSDKCIEGTGKNKEGLYKGQCGMMLRKGGRVFAVNQSVGIFVIDAKVDTLQMTIPSPANAKDAKNPHGFGSIVLAEDGQIYASVAKDQGGTGATAPFILKIDPSTLEVSRIEIKEVEQNGKKVQIYPPANSWYAWTADGFRAAPKEKAIYWNGGNGTWFSGLQYFRYNLESGEFKRIITLEKKEPVRKFYGGCYAINPISGNIFSVLFEDFATKKYEVVEYDNTGKEVYKMSLKEHHWFPALPIFPDNAAPVAKAIDKVLFKTGESREPVKINLLDYVSDEDTQHQTIWADVASVSKKGIVDVKVVMDTLTIAPVIQDGEATITIRYNSNGKVVTTPINVALGTYASIEEVSTQPSQGILVKDGKLVAFDLSGFRLAIYDIAGRLVGTANIRDAYEELPFELLSGTYVVYTASDQVINGTPARKSFKVVL